MCYGCLVGASARLTDVDQLFSWTTLEDDSQTACRAAWTILPIIEYGHATGLPSLPISNGGAVLLGLFEEAYFILIFSYSLRNAAVFQARICQFILVIQGHGHFPLQVIYPLARVSGLVRGLPVSVLGLLQGSLSPTDHLLPPC